MGWIQLVSSWYRGLSAQRQWRHTVSCTVGSAPWHLRNRATPLSYLGLNSIGGFDLRVSLSTRAAVSNHRQCYAILVHQSHVHVNNVDGFNSECLSLEPLVAKPQSPYTSVQHHRVISLFHPVKQRGELGLSIQPPAEGPGIRVTTVLCGGGSSMPCPGKERRRF